MTSRAWLAGGSCAALTLLLGLIVGGLAGCGSGSGSKITTSADIPGNWEFTATIGRNGVVPIGVYLTSTGSVVSGTAGVQMPFPNDCINGCCGGPFAQFNDSLTGKLDDKGNLTLGSTVPNGGPVFTMTAVVSGGTMTNGTFNLTGGCPAKGTITGVELPTLNGTYAGTVKSTDTGRSYSLSTTLQQSATINAQGSLNVTGTATFTGYPCLTSTTMAMPLSQNSGLSGDLFGVTMNGAGGATLSISGTLSQDGKTVGVTYLAAGGSCHLDLGRGTLTLQ
ncbi:MAG: hypothetical protein ACYCOR_20045 [Acidobacteriaceae bacterium]